MAARGRGGGSHVRVLSAAKGREGEGFVKALLAAPAFVTGAQSSVLMQGDADTLGMKPVVANFAEDALVG